MSTRLPSQKNSFPWFEILAGVFGLTLTTIFVIVGILGVLSLGRTHCLLACKSIFHWLKEAVDPP